MTVVEFAILTTFAVYLVGAAKITKPLRALLPEVVRTALACAPCSGTWIGLGLGLAGLSPWARDVRGLVLSAAAGAVLSAIGRTFMDLGVIESKP